MKFDKELETPIIASHNAGTGEPSKNFFHSLLTPFARCQRETISGQYAKGVRLFDIRVRMEFYAGILTQKIYICHGLWESETSIVDVIELLKTLNDTSDKVQMLITYEGRPSARVEKKFVEWVKGLELPEWMTIHSINIKLPTWRTVWVSKDAWTYRQCYPKITGWKCLLPIPWFWNKIEHFTSDDTDVEMRDFI